VILFRLGLPRLCRPVITRIYSTWILCYYSCVSFGFTGFGLPRLRGSSEFQGTVEFMFYGRASRAWEIN
jgi:hypothetical protein